MTHALTLIVVLPLAGFVLNGVAGTPRPGVCLGRGLRAAHPCLPGCHEVLPRSRRRQWSSAHRDALHLGTHGRAQLRRRFLLRPAHGGDGPDRHWRRDPRPHLFHRLHEGRRELCTLLRLPESVPVLHAGAGARQITAGAVRLGRRGARVLSADRLLVRGSRQGPCGQEGLHHQSRRRCRLPAPACSCSTRPSARSTWTASIGLSDGPVAPAVSASLVGILLFIGASGESATPLHVWLPDAMAGPTRCLR